MTEKALKANYRVYTMDSVPKMLSILRNAIPDMILLDAGLSDRSGMEALKFLKSQRSYADIPVIILSDK
jgi:DNA-binding response OmpR family regulator